MSLSKVAAAAVVTVPEPERSTVRRVALTLDPVSGHLHAATEGEVVLVMDEATGHLHPASGAPEDATLILLSGGASPRLVID